LAALLDVNALIALVDSDHVGHAAITRWFRKHHRSGWATCSITENAMVRVLSQAAYPSGQRTPAEAIETLNALKLAFAESHDFWSDQLSLTDSAVFNPAMIAGARQVTDAYLLGLAIARSSTLVSFDRSLPWQAIRGGSTRLIQSPA